ncbi:hypothetical protein ACFE04_026300 [Oxalis oulophora]
MQVTDDQTNSATTNSERLNTNKKLLSNVLRGSNEYYNRHVDGSPLKSDADRERVMQCLEASIQRRVSELSALCEIFIRNTEIESKVARKRFFQLNVNEIHSLVQTDHLERSYNSKIAVKESQQLSSL